MVALSPIERGWFDQRGGAECFLLGKPCERSWEPVEASLAGLARELAPASKNELLPLPPTRKRVSRERSRS
jgi:hypothetical protein